MDGCATRTCAPRTRWRRQRWLTRRTGRPWVRRCASPRVRARRGFRAS